MCWWAYHERTVFRRFAIVGVARCHRAIIHQGCRIGQNGLARVVVSALQVVVRGHRADNRTRRIPQLDPAGRSETKVELEQDASSVCASYEEYWEPRGLSAHRAPAP